jgi:cyclophilin family peptidyl-prolyl cis-trans isomerase/protein-disulfide isomerase
MMRVYAKALLLATALTLLYACAKPQNPPSASPPNLPTFSAPTPISNSCQSVSTAPTPDANAPSLFAKAGKGLYEHSRGNELAVVTIIVYSDFACETCAALAPLLDSLQQDHPNDLRLIYRHFPMLSAYPNAALAVQAAEAAHLQGKFWEMHTALFKNQAEWTKKTNPALTDYSIGLATALGLDSGQFESDLESPAIAKIPQETWQSGLEIGLPGTPLLLINGQIYTGPINYTSLQLITGLITLGQRQFTTCPAQSIDPSKSYFATLKTEKGEVVLKLRPDLAPATVNSFVFLARQGWYNDITFHRVLPGSIVQTGDPSGTGAGNPGYFTMNEIWPEQKFDRAGLVGMSNSGPDTNGSQFFITLGPVPELNGLYTIFGEVVSGLEVLAQLTPRDAQPGFKLPPGDRLQTIIIEER